MINRAVLAGRLTKDVEIRKTQSGISMASFVIACDRPKGKNDQEAKADFIRCVAWRQSADFLADYGKKGSLVAVDGSIRTGSYEKDGQTVYTTDVYADTVRLLDSRKQGQDPKPVATGSMYTKDVAGEVAQSFGTSDDRYMISDDDLPF